VPFDGPETVPSQEDNRPECSANAPGYSERVLRVAVKLPAAGGRIGDYLADVTALEAAGADSIWLDARNADSTEAWIHLGAIAAVTHRVRLGVTVDPAGGWPSGVDVLERLTGGRIVVAMPRGSEAKALFEQLKRWRSASPSPSTLIICGSYAEAEKSVAPAHGVIVPAGEQEVRALRADSARDREFELWVDVSVPADKAGWADMIAALETAGATGIVVPWDPRLIDLLRSGGEPDDRSDLLISTG
jgi:hypothetical protein